MTAMRRLRALCGQVQMASAPVEAKAEEMCDGDAFSKLMVKKAPTGTKVNKKQIKTYGFVKRDESKVSHEEFVGTWRNPHIPNVVKSGLDPRRYIVNLFDESSAAFDGCAQMWFDDMSHYKTRFKATPAFKDAFSDAVQGNPATMLCREYVFIDGPREGKKATVLLKGKQGVTRRQIYDHYFGKYAHATKEAIAKTVGPDRIRQVRYCLSVVMDPTKTDYAGVVEIWAPDAKVLEALQQSIPEDKVWASLLDNAGAQQFLGTEVIGVDDVLRKAGA